MDIDRIDNTVTFYLDGDFTPLSFAKTIIESDVLSDEDFREFVDYLSVHVEYHCQHGKATNSYASL